MTLFYLVLCTLLLIVTNTVAFRSLNIAPRYNLKPQWLSTQTDFGDFAVGQEYEGQLVSAKAFGIFVDISTGTNVLLPRSQLSRGTYEKLKAMTNSKSAEKVKLEIVSISTENKTLSGKYIPESYTERADISSLSGEDLDGKEFSATVVSGHDFGLFAELDKFGVEGLVPASKLDVSSDQIKSKYPPGSTISVNIAEMNVQGKKLVLSLVGGNRPDVSDMSRIGDNTWMEAVVESSTNFGLFCRPAGYDNVGLLHNSQIPRDLIAALKKKAPIPTGQNKTDVESLLGKGDVLKVRIKNVALGERKLELSMLPFRGDDIDDGYIVEGRDPEGEEDKFTKINSPQKVWVDGEDNLLWWRGEKYMKAVKENAGHVDQETEIINESSDIVEGTWRRMFELDLRDDQADFTSKLFEREQKELDDEIGELGGLHEEMVDAAGYGSDVNFKKFGSFVSRATLPTDWKNQMDYFKEFEETEIAISAKLKGGKSAEQEEFEALMKEVESELTQSNLRRGAVPDQATKVPDEVSAETVASSSPEEKATI